MADGHDVRSVARRFWAKVRKTESCWLWTGAIQSATGYGALQVGTHGRPRAGATHRLSWEMHFGPIPEGMDVCHACDVRSCVNPAHLFLGSRLDNMRDSKAKGWPNGRPGPKAVVA